MTQIRLSADFFRRPFKKEILKNYEEHQKNSKPIPTDGNNQKNDGRSVVLKGRSKKIVTKEDSKKIFEEDNNRLRFERRALDFSFKNRFRFEPRKIDREVFAKNAEMCPPTDPRLSSKDSHRLEQNSSQADTTGQPAADPKIPAQPQPEQPKSSTEHTDCVICFAKKADAVCMPCGHGGACQSCAMKISLKNSQCFLCKKPIEVVLKIDPSKTVGNMVLVISSIQIE